MPLVPFEPIPFEAPSGDAIETLLVRVARPEDVEAWERTWAPRLKSLERSDGDWSWGTQIDRAAKVEGALCLAVTSGRGLEGLMSLSFVGDQPSRFSDPPGAPSLYVEYVGVHPDNQPPPVGTRRVRGVGRILLGIAQRISEAVGASGRVGLHSKPDAAAFYRTLGMLTTDEPEETEDGSWLYFETRGR